MALKAKVPLFPLGVVLLPHRPLPLHIFEEKYKEMIALCQAQNLQFGIICFDGKRLQGAGCMAKISDVIKRYEDGRLDILTHGTRRFYLKNIDQSKPYLQGDVTFFDDVMEQFDAKDIKLAQKGMKLLEDINKLTGRKESWPEVSLKTIADLSFVIAGCEGFTIGEKQHFLEMKSARERLEKSVKVMKKIHQRLQLKKEIAETIQSNGHLPELL